VSQQINLFNPIFLQQKKYFSAAAIVQALGLFFLGMIVFYAYAVFQVDALTRQADDGARELQQLKERQAKAAAEFGVRLPSAQLEQEIRNAQAALQARQALLAGMNSGAFGSQYGLSQYMEALSRRVLRGLWISGFKVEEGGENFSISGNAVSAELVPAFVRGLGQETMMHGRSLGNLSMSSQEIAIPIAGGGKPVQVRVIRFDLSSGAGAPETPANSSGAAAKN
jgi:hypothetical protein